MVIKKRNKTHLCNHWLFINKTNVGQVIFFVNNHQFQISKYFKIRELPILVSCGRILKLNTH